MPTAVLRARRACSGLRRVRVFGGEEREGEREVVKARGGRVEVVCAECSGCGEASAA